MRWYLIVVLACIKWVFLIGDFLNLKKKKENSQVQLMLTKKRFQVFCEAVSASGTSAQWDVCVRGSLSHLSLPQVLIDSRQLLQKHAIPMRDGCWTRSREDAVDCGDG